MSRSRAVLVLGNDNKSPLVEKLFRFGFVPIIHDDMFEGLKRLRHERFEVILVDRDHLEADVIEFVLNVRDFDESIPIIAAGKSLSPFENQALLQQGNVVVFDKVPDDIHEKIEAILHF